MTTRYRIPKLLTAGALVAATALVLGPHAAAEPASDSCDAWQMEYKLSGRLRLDDTPMGAGDGIYNIGPGKLALRFDNRSGEPGGRVQMLSYEMHDHFVVVSKVIFWKTTVTTDTHTSVATNACGVAARGVLSGRTVGWSSKVTGYRTDGTLDCDGSMCGKFGAPPPGKSQLHLGPSDVQFKPLKLSKDGKTFTMAETFVSRSDMPKQSAYIALAGREISRKCVKVAACK